MKTHFIAWPSSVFPNTRTTNASHVFLSTPPSISLVIADNVRHESLDDLIAFFPFYLDIFRFQAVSCLIRQCNVLC